MKLEELKSYTINTIKFDNIDEAFEDFCWEMTASDIINFISDKEKERIIKTSPSYIKHNDKWYFNSDFQDILDGKQIDEIIEEKDKESDLNV